MWAVCIGQGVRECSQEWSELSGCGKWLVPVTSQAVGRASLWIDYGWTPLCVFFFLSCPAQSQSSFLCSVCLSVFIYWCIKVSIAEVNTMTKSILGRKRFISSLKTLGLLYYWRNSGQELIQRGNGGTLLAGLACSAWLLIAPRTTCPGVVPATVGWVLPHQSSVNKVHHSLAHRPVRWGIFSIEVPSS